MFERLKRALVESYVGAIALGYLLAQGVLHFVGIFTSPVAGWIGRKEYRALVPQAGALKGFAFQDALPDLMRFILVLLVGYLLLRWLYMRPLKKEPYEPIAGSE